jgi:hypothetical protein
VTDEATAALNGAAQVDAVAVDTDLPFWALHVAAWAEHAETVDADLVGWARELASEAGKRTFSFDADRSFLWAERDVEVFVDEPVAVVVDTVAHLGIPTRTLALSPGAIDADLVARSAGSLAVLDEIVVNDAVAVVVDAVAHLGLGPDAAFALEPAEDAGQDPRITGSDVATARRAAAGIVLVGLLVTVVVETVAHFVDRTATADTH